MILGLPWQQSLGCVVVVVQERPDRAGAGALEGLQGLHPHGICSRAVGDSNLPFAVGLSTTELGTAGEAQAVKRGQAAVSGCLGGRWLLPQSWF